MGSRSNSRRRRHNVAAYVLSIGLQIFMQVAGSGQQMCAERLLACRSESRGRRESTSADSTTTHPASMSCCGQYLLTAQRQCQLCLSSSSDLFVVLALRCDGVSQCSHLKAASECIGALQIMTRHLDSGLVLFACPGPQPTRISLALEAANQSRALQSSDCE